MGLPSPIRHVEPMAARDHVIENTHKYCGLTHSAPVFEGLPVNGIVGGLAWQAVSPGFRQNFPWDEPTCDGPEERTTFRVAFAYTCPKGFNVIAWHEDSAGNPNPAAEQRANLIYVCVQPLPKIPTCPPPTGGAEAPKVQYGNPVECATRTKIQVEQDIPSLSLGGLGFTRTYRSNVMAWGSEYSVLGASTGPGSSTSKCFPGYYDGPDGQAIACFRLYPLWEDSFAYKGSSNLPLQFWSGSGGLVAPGFVDERVIKRPNTGGADVVTATNTVEQFDAQGKFVSRRYASGARQTATYSDVNTSASIAPGPGYLITVEDQFSRKLHFRYDESGKLVKVIGAAGAEYDYESDAYGNITRVRFPDGYSRQYLFNETGYTAGADLPFAMTGLVDEHGVRTSTFTYDSSGLAQSTERAGGVERFTFSGNIVTTPLGEVLTYAWASNSGTTRKLRSPTVQRTCAGCSANQMSSYTYDANGNAISSVGFSGGKSCYAHDARNLEVLRLEGLGRSDSCPANLASHQIQPPSGLSSGARKVWRRYHPDWRLVTGVAEPGRITTYVYNGQPDPTRGNEIATCAPATATVVDSLPIAVICRKIEQGTGDLYGNSGFDATVDATVVPRVETWTYNQYGQVLTHDGPRRDVADITSFTYYGDTAFGGTDPNAVGHTVGDLRTVTNAAGQVTQYTKYNKAGQLLEMIDSNNAVTSYAYDLRNRLIGVTLGDQTTAYTYDAIGQLTRITHPDSSWIGYEYDDAHRQTAVLDNLGNRIEYTLDNAGNRTAEEVKDPSGALRRQMTRTPDALGRIQQTVGRE